MTLAHNPAERLEHIVLAIRGCAPSAKLFKSFTQVFEAASPGETFRGVGALLDLPELARKAVLDVTDDPFYLEWYEQVAAAVLLTRNLDRQTHDFQAYTPDPVVYSLRAAARLRPGYASGALPNEIGDIRTRAEALRSSIADDDEIPDELKRFMLVQIDRILIALREFGLRGELAVEDACDAVTGAIVRAISAFPDSDWTEASKSRIKQIHDLMLAMGGLCGAAGSMVALSPAVQAAIGFVGG